MSNSVALMATHGPSLPLLALPLPFPGLGRTMGSALTRPASPTFHLYPPT